MAPVNASPRRVDYDDVDDRDVALRGDLGDVVFF